MEMVVTPCADSFGHSPDSISFQVFGNRIQMETKSFNIDGELRIRHRDFLIEDLKKVLIVAEMTSPPRART